MTNDVPTTIRKLTGNVHFDDPDFDLQFIRVLGHVYDGGADVGECFSTAFRIRAGDYESWYQEWHRTALRVEDIARWSLDKHHNVSAREAFLRATEYHRTAEFFLRDDLDDPRLLRTADDVRACFHKACELLDVPVQMVEIPYESATLPGYFFQPDGMGTARATLIVLSGYDSFTEEGYFSMARAALERGYNVLMFDGPGQGHVLRRQKIFFRPDWEAVVGPAIDILERFPEVDRDKMVLVGRSFAGYLAPRAAALEHRLAALIADPGVYDVGEGIAQMPGDVMKLIQRGKEPQVNRLFEDRFRQDRSLEFFFHSRMAAHGLDSVSAYLMEMMRYSLRGLAQEIICPTAVCSAGGDDIMRGGQSKQLYDALTCPKTLLEFGAEEGAGDHCEMGASSLFYQRVFDWLDETLAEDRRSRVRKKIGMRREGPVPQLPSLVGIIMK